MLDTALTLARQSEPKKYRIAAVITDKKGTVLTVGLNSYTKTHPTQAYYAEKCGNRHQIFLHAEMEALVKLHKYFATDPVSIYIARVDKQGRELPVEPCPICKMALKDAGIKDIHCT